MTENTTGPTLYHRWSSIKGQMLRMALTADLRLPDGVTILLDLKY
ncbi:MAG: hypothetical protein ACYDDP_03240 [Acidithiobacillus sp.]